MRELTRHIPARTEKVRFSWMKREFYTFETFRRTREKLRLSVPKKCDWCRTPFKDEDMLGLACPKDGQHWGGNMLLCPKCVAMAASDSSQDDEVATEVKEKVTEMDPSVQWIQPEWQPMSTYPRWSNDPQYVWFWHEDLGLMYGYIMEEPSGIQVHIGFSYHTEFGIYSHRDTRFDGLIYWMPRAGFPSGPTNEIE